jgi:hypothetical protein
MLKKYLTQVIAVAVIAASALFITGCGEAEDTSPLETIPEPEGPVGDEEGGEAPAEKGGEGGA